LVFALFGAGALRLRKTKRRAIYFRAALQRQLKTIYFAFS
jgi:hypothetical protein